MNAFLSMIDHPSVYAWLLPIKHISAQTIDELAQLRQYPTFRQFTPAIIYAILFGFVRMIAYNLFIKPLAIYALKLNFSTQPKNKVIDQALPVVNYKKMNHVVSSLSEQLNISEEAIRQYLSNRKRDKSQQLKLSKFSEAFWRFVFYSSLTIWGFYTLFYQSVAPWVFDTTKLWHQWPYHQITWQIHVYYQAELACYIHQLMWTEVNRSDAIEMIIHHLVTIFLIVLSYLTNFCRIGTSILLVHDFADLFLESGKCFNYMGKLKDRQWAQNICDVFFGLFAISFFVTRLVLFPRLVYSYLVEGPNIMGMWDGYWVFAILLSTLQCLHIFWFYLILRMIYKLTIAGTIEKDERSDDEEELDDPTIHDKGEVKFIGSKPAHLITPELKRD